MISKLYKNIASGLKAVKKCPVYKEGVPQNFAQPSFLVSFYGQNPLSGINGRLENTVSVDVSYFPETAQRGGCDTREECWEIAQDLMRGLRIEDFKIKNRNFNITDNILHFMFEVTYREYLETTGRKMQTMSQNTDIKEE